MGTQSPKQICFSWQAVGLVLPLFVPGSTCQRSKSKETDPLHECCMSLRSYLSGPPCPVRAHGLQALHQRTQVDPTHLGVPQQLLR